LLSKLLFNRAPGMEFLNTWEAKASDPQALVKAVLDSAEATAVTAGLSDAQFASYLVQNVFGANAQVEQFAQDYLGQHTRADLLLVGVQSETVVNQLYTTEGLWLA
jgi:hypothetical protein